MKLKYETANCAPWKARSGSRRRPGWDEGGWEAAAVGVVGARGEGMGLGGGTLRGLPGRRRTGGGGCSEGGGGGGWSETKGGWQWAWDGRGVTEGDVCSGSVEVEAEMGMETGCSRGRGVTLRSREVQGGVSANQE